MSTCLITTIWPCVFFLTHLFLHFLSPPKVHKAVGQYWAELARAFADDPVLPINATIFAQTLLKDYLAQTRTAVQQLHDKFPAETEPAVRQLANMDKQAQLFLQQAVRFEQV